MGARKGRRANGENKGVHKCGGTSDERSAACKGGERRSRSDERRGEEVMKGETESLRDEGRFTGR